MSTDGLARPRAVLFDWDNTLVDTWAVIHEVMNATFAHYGLPTWSLDETRARVRHSLRNSFPDLFGERWQEAGEWFYAYFADVHLDRLRPLSGADAMLRRLAADGIYLGVVSNKVGRFLRSEAEHLGWAGLFGQMVGAFDAENDKPATDPVHLALAGSGIEPGPDVWFAGDANIDLECALNAGCVPILVRQAAPGADEFPIHPPALHFRDCATLSKSVLSMP
jgi:phosphoglycolate phosphatase